jgi:hypothetical protein
MINIQSRKQLFIDERFIDDQRNVALVVNPPEKAGRINVDARTAPSIVEHNGTGYLYQGLNGPSSVCTSTDGIAWSSPKQIAGVDDTGPMWTSINSVFIDPKDDQYPFKGLYERTPKELIQPDGKRNHVAPVPGGLYLCRFRDGFG